MLKFLLVSVVGMVAMVPHQAAAQKAAPTVYMQIFYEGPNWLAGQRVLSYSPAFRGRTQELVQEYDSTRQLSPSSIYIKPRKSVTTLGYDTTRKGNLLPDLNGEVYIETPADRKQARQREAERFNSGLRMLENRADLGKAVLAKALNEAAADGWEVVQFTATGTAGGLVYLLRHR